jgi:hypothetical protein
VDVTLLLTNTPCALLTPFFCPCAWSFFFRGILLFLLWLLIASSGKGISVKEEKKKRRKKCKKENPYPSPASFFFLMVFLFFKLGCFGGRPVLPVKNRKQVLVVLDICQETSARTPRHPLGPLSSSKRD